MTPEDRASYLRWRAEAATPEVFAAFKRRGVTLPDQQKTAEAGKQASQPFYQRALNTQLQQPQWDANQSFLQNIAGNLQAAQQRGQRLVDQEDNFRSYLASQNPYAAAQQLAETAQSGQDPVVHNQLDQLLFRHRFAG
jgi:hypothetical protein